MAHRIAHCIALAATLLLLACGGADSQQALLLDEIAMQMNTAPDSALARLDSMDAETLPRHQRMRWELLRGNCLNKTDVPSTTDSLMLRVADYFDHHGTPNQRLLAHYVLGCTYRDMGDAPRALECYHDAVAQVDTADTGCDLATLSRVHSQMGRIFQQMSMEEQFTAEMRIAEEIAWMAKDTISALFFKKTECSTLYNHRKYQECIAKALEIRQLYLDLNLPERADLVCTYPAISYLALGLYPKAKEYIDIYENCSYFKTNSENLIGQKGPLHIYKGQYYLGVNNTDSAECCFKEAMEYLGQAGNALLIYDGLYKTYILKGLMDSVYKYTELYAAEKRQEYDESLAEATLRAEQLYNYDKEKEIANQEKQRRNRMTIYALLSALLALGMFAVAACFLYKKEKKANELNAIKEEYRQALREQSQLEQQIRRLQTENATQTNECALLLKRQEELMHQTAVLEERLEQMGASTKGMTLDDSAIVNHFKKKTEHPTSIEITDHDWQELKDIVERLYPTFHYTLNKNASLSETDYRLCLLIKIGITTSSCDILLEKDTNYSAKRRSRLHQKVFGTPANGKTFDQKVRDIK